MDIEEALACFKAEALVYRGGSRTPYSPEIAKYIELMNTAQEAQLSATAQNMIRETITAHVVQLGREAELLPQVMEGKTSLTVYSQLIVEKAKRFELELKKPDVSIQFSVDELLKSPETKDITATLVREAIINPYDVFHSRTILPANVERTYKTIDKILEKYRGDSALLFGFTTLMAFLIIGAEIGDAIASYFYGNRTTAVRNGYYIGMLGGTLLYFGALFSLGSKVRSALNKDVRQLTKEREGFEGRLKYLDDRITQDI